MSKQGRIITIGSFDGVHLGHRALLQKSVEEARRRGLKTTAITFEVPPRQVLEGRDKLSVLTTPLEKAFLLKREGIDSLVTLKFNRDFSRIPSYIFLRDHLIREYNAKGIVVGFDFRFGIDRSAGPAELVKWGQNFEIPVWVLPPVRKGGMALSSTEIREAMSDNRFKAAQNWLGHPHVIMGKVVKGRGVGKKIGFPTANIRTDDGKILPRGVFLVRIRQLADAKNLQFKRKVMWGVCNIGLRPTFLRTSKVAVEVHVLEKVSSLVGKTLCLELLERRRLERKYPHVEALKQAILQDISWAKTVLKKYSSRPAGSDS